MIIVSSDLMEAMVDDVSVYLEDKVQYIPLVGQATAVRSIKARSIQIICIETSNKDHEAYLVEAFVGSTRVL